MTNPVNRGPVGSGSGAARARQIPTSRKIAFTVILILVFGILCESAVRLRAWIKYGAAGADISGGMMVVDPATGLRTARPGYSVNSRNVSISINSLGFRGDEIAREKPRNTVRIACVGASTTFCTEASNNHSTWPARLQEGLQRQFPDVSFEVINTAFPGYVITENQQNVRQRVLPLDPDLVIYYEVNNDLALDTQRLAREAGLIAPSEGNLSPGVRWLSQHSLFFDLLNKNAKILTVSDKPTGKLTTVPSDLPNRFIGELGKMHDELQQRGIPMLMSTFVVKYRRDQPRPTQLANASLAFYYMPWMTIDGLLDGMDAYNEAILQYAHAHDVPVVDDRAVIPADAEHFADWAHLTDAGCITQAERFRRYLDSSGLIQKIVEKRRAAN